MNHLLLSKTCAYNYPRFADICAGLFAAPLYPLCDVISYHALS